jgi:hypothetical protein
MSEWTMNTIQGGDGWGEAHRDDQTLTLYADDDADTDPMAPTQATNAAIFILRFKQLRVS